MYHLRHGIQLLSNLRSWVMAAGLFTLVLLAGEAGLVPGLDPQLGEFVAWLVGLIRQGAEMVWRLV